MTEHDLPPEILAPLRRLEAIMPTLNETTKRAMALFRTVEQQLVNAGAPAAFVPFHYDATDVYSLVYCRYGHERTFRFCIKERDKALVGIDEVERGVRLAAFAVLPTLLGVIVDGCERLLVGTP